MSYPIPSDALDDRLGFVGTAGSGKTYNAGSAVEKLLAAGARVVIVDPLDVWWGLRLTPDGKPSRFNPVIFGGAHGDMPLNEQAGRLIGEAVAGMAESCIVSLGGLPTKAAERRFMLPFLESVYGKASGDPVHFVFDEADMWAPQQERDKGDASKILGMMETIIRRGRVRGFIPWLITQRPAVLNKNVLSQVDGLITFKLTASQDRNAIGAWVKAQADEGEWTRIDASLPAMQRGQGVVWIPGRGVLETAQFPIKATFDSSRTPKRGERLERRELKPLNLDTLRSQLANIEDDAKANDPKALKAEVARLSAALNKALRQIKEPPAALKVVANADEVEAARKEGERVGVAIGIARARAALDALRVDGAAPPAPKRDRQTARTVSPVDPTMQTPAPASTGPLSPSRQRVVDAIAWWAAVGIEPVARDRAAVIAGLSPKASTFGVYVSQLVQDGYVETLPGAVQLTGAGKAIATAPVNVSKDQVVAQARSQLKPAAAGVFDRIVSAYPAWIGRGELADECGLSRTASTLGVYISEAGKLGFVESRPGQVRAADWLFP